MRGCLDHAHHATRTGARCSPPMRGCLGDRRQAERHHPHMVPAQAGVSRATPHDWTSRPDRMVPAQAGVSPTCTAESRRRWPWSPSMRGCLETKRGEVRLYCRRVPRSCGGVSRAYEIYMTLLACSPFQRGCLRGLGIPGPADLDGPRASGGVSVEPERSQWRYTWVFPAYAGVSPDVSFCDPRTGPVLPAYAGVSPRL